MANGDYEATHKKILDCGKNIFKTQGFEKANLRAICKAAGVTTVLFMVILKIRKLFSPN